MKKRILIYSIITFCIIAMMQNVGRTLHQNDELTEFSKNDLTEEIVNPEDYSLSSAESEFSVPRPTNLSNIPRTVSVAKRTLTRTNDAFCLLKDGKLLNRRSTTQYNDNLKRFPSGLIETTHHLISLGKLVI